VSRSEKTTDPRYVEQVTDEMKAAVLAKAVDGKVSCPQLRKLAEDLGVAYGVAGAAADLAGVRVGGCSLGCF
jgi:DNA-binding transcriptional regulator YhcF (GntR family)